MARRGQAAQRLGFRVSGFGFRVSGFGFRVSGFGFRVRWLPLCHETKLVMQQLKPLNPILLYIVAFPQVLHLGSALLRVSRV